MTLLTLISFTTVIKHFLPCCHFTGVMKHLLTPIDLVSPKVGKIIPALFRLPAGNLPDDRVCRVERVCYSSVCTVVKRVFPVACLASVSVLFRSKERGTRAKDRAKNGASKRTENPLPRSLFAPKQNGNACYAGYISCDFPSGLCMPGGTGVFLACTIDLKPFQIFSMSSSR